MKPESRELIAGWAPGRGIENHVASAAIEARSPTATHDMSLTPTPPGAAARPGLGTFERYLTLWVALCIIAGIVLGRLAPEPFHALGQMNVAEVNMPVAVLIWLMIVPMLVKVDFAALDRVAEAVARHRRDGRHQLAGQAVQHGAARLAVHRRAVPALSAGRRRSTATSPG